MILTTLVALTLATAPARAQGPPAPAPSASLPAHDSRWTPWLGCWQGANDLVGAGERVCITPVGAAGVTLATLVGIQRAGEEAITPDGASHAVDNAGCTGTEHAEWSHNGPRVFRRAEVMCGQEAPRTVSALMFLAPGGSWVDVRLVDLSGTKSVRVRRYRRAADQRLPDGGRLPAAAPGAAFTTPDVGAGTWQVADVVEASAKVPAEVVQAALSELNAPFTLNAKGLVAMADAGVTGSVIDLMVALTYPRHFVVDRAGGSADPLDAIGVYGSGMYDPFYSPIMYAPPYMGLYSYMDYSYWIARYGYPGYGYYSGFDPRFPGGGRGWVVVDSGPGSSAQPPEEGRVVNGRGYTRVRTREADPVHMGADRGGATSGTSFTGGSDPGSSGASPQGYSGGGSSGSGSGRTAVPRPPG